jgi:PPK2 family polyphosphate:nucleotide phosphotransferase
MGKKGKDKERRKRDRSAEVVAPPPRVSDLLRVPLGPVDLSAVSTAPGAGPTDREAAERAVAELAPRLAALQEQLFAHGRSGGTRRLLLVCQGMDTSGKGGVMEHVVGLMDPQGCDITSFKAPTPEELEHDFLWRIRRRVPEAGIVGVFDRSHYEDVLIARVRSLVPRATVGRRYGQINRFEKQLTDSGVSLVKVMLHISADEQKQRLLDRLDDPTKHWKYNPGDVDERARWADYQQAYELALGKCSTEHAPWYVVPADAKWYRNWAITSLLVEHLEAMDLQWPPADFDVAAERARVEAS